VRIPRLAEAAVVVTAVLVALAPIAPTSAAPGGSDLPPSLDETAPDAGSQRAASALPRHRYPNRLIKEVYASRPFGGPRVEPPHAPPGALCQQFLGKPNPYRNPRPNVDQIVNEGLTLAGTGQGCPAAQNETTIAVNPNDPNNIVAGANDYRLFNTRVGRNDSSGFAYTSMDGGKTWVNVMLPKLVLQSGATGPLSIMDGAGDPSISFGPDNVVYYSNLVFSRLTSASGQVVSISRDGGLTWSDPKILRTDGVNPDGTPTPTPFFNDKNWIAADPNSGTVYVTWTLFTSDTAGAYLESPIVVSKSSDFGETWSPITRISPPLTGFAGGITPFAQGSNPVVGRDGSLYVPYETSICATAACDQFEDHNAITVATSRDRGRSFTNAEVTVDFDFPTNTVTGRGTLTGQNFRLNSFPLTAYDPKTDEVWITWADDRNGTYTSAGQSIKTNGDVFVVRGRNGRNWDAPFRVGSPQDEVYPAIAALNKRVAVSYWTRKYDPNGVGLDYAYSVGTGSGIHNARVRRITTQTSNPQVQFTQALPDGSLLQGVFIGDYTGLAIGRDMKIHPTWVDFRGRPGANTPNQDAYTQAISVR